MRKPMLSVLCVAVLAAAAAGQDDPKKRDINVDFTVGWGGCYRPMQWTPILIGITTPFDKPLDCIVRIAASQDELNSLQISRREVLMPARPREIPLVTKLAFAVDNCTVTIQGTQTGYFWSKSYQLWNQPSGARPLTPVGDKELLIGVSGRQGFGIMNLADASGSRSEGTQGKVYVRYKFRRVLPADWTGYASLDALVLYDLDWTALTRHQTQAICQWVSNGGRVLIVLGGRPLPAKHALARLLPLQIGQPREVDLPRSVLRQWGCTGVKPRNEKLACWPLTLAAAARGWAPYRRDVEALGMSGPVGFGRVGVCAGDPSAVGGRQGRNVAQFWIDHLRPLLYRREIYKTNSSGDSGDSWSYRLGTAGTANNAVLEHLYSVEELRPIHIGWVVLVLAVLAVLIGPVDYLVLKRLGRLPLTWVTASVCIALFSVGAYYGVGYIRGGALQARVVSVVDGIEGSPVRWSTRYLGIFAPRSDDHQLTGLDRSQWWSALAPTRGESLYQYNERLGSRNVYCQQHIDGGNLPTSVPINIWAMQCLLAESPAAAVPVRGSVRRDGDEWVITVENLAKEPIAKGYVLVGPETSVPFGAVPAGARREFRGRGRNWRSWKRYVRQGGGQSEYAGREATRVVATTALLAQGCLERTEGILRYLQDGAAVICAEYDASPVPFGIAGRSCRFRHKQLVRLVVFPEGRK